MEASTTHAGAPHALQADLFAIVGEQHVLREGSMLASYSVSSNLFPPAHPHLVVRPANADEILRILTLAGATRTPVLVRGRGLSTGGLLEADPAGIMLDTTRLDRVLTIDEDDHFVTAECGIALGALQAAVARTGHYVNTVQTPLADGVSLGGILSGMLGGGNPARGARHGLNGRQLLGLSVALPNGQLLHTGAGGANVHHVRALARGASGPDLAGLFLGDGGAFGVKIQATLQIFPTPPLSAAETWSFTDFAGFHAAFTDVTRIDPPPFAMLYGHEENGAFRCYVLAEADDPATLRQHLRTIADSCRRAGGDRLPGGERGARGLFSAEVFAAQEAEGQRSQSLTLFCSRRQLPRVRATIGRYFAAALRERGLDHRGVSSTVTYRPNQRHAVHITFVLGWNTNALPDGAPELAELLQLVIEGYELAVRLGLSPTGHHSVTAAGAAAGWSSEFRSTMVALKQVFDPHYILNPGHWGPHLATGVRTAVGQGNHR